MERTSQESAWELPISKVVYNKQASNLDSLLTKNVTESWQKLKAEKQEASTKYP